MRDTRAFRALFLSFPLRDLLSSAVLFIRLRGSVASSNTQSSAHYLRCIGRFAVFDTTNASKLDNLLDIHGILYTALS
jgi:hypothetical protein